MKYIEELNNGDKFLYQNYCYLLTIDYRQINKQIQRCCVNMHNGSISWLNNSTIIDQISVFYQNQENLLVEIKNEKNN
jgi:hypothetical protein